MFGARGMARAEVVELLPECAGWTPVGVEKAVRPENACRGADPIAVPSAGAEACQGVQHIMARGTIIAPAWRSEPVYPLPRHPGPRRAAP